MSSSRTIVIEGIEPYGLPLAEKLAHIRRDDVMLVDENEKLCEKAAEKLDALILNGKMTDKSLEEEIKKEFDIFVAAKADDSENLLSCLYVKEHYKVGKMLAVAQSEVSEELFTKNGIQTVSPEKAAVKILLRYMAGDPKLIDKITTSGKSELLAFEVKEGSKLDGQKISTLPVKEGDYNIVCVLRDKELEFAKPDYELKAGDVLQIAVKPKYHKKLQGYM